jgi:hypothetical protein
MNMHKPIYTILLAITIFTLSASGQEIEGRPNARLLDAMTEPNCERLQAGMDTAGIEIQNNPADVLFAIVYPATGQGRGTEGTAKQIDAWLKHRRFDPSRITIAVGAPRARMQVELIAVPPGAETPKTAMLWERRSRFADVKTSKKAVLVTVDTEDENPCFQEGSAVPDLGNYLNENPRTRVRIVIKTSSVKDFNDSAKEIRSELSGVPSGRLRIVHVRSPKWPKAPFKETEYWIMP